MNIQLIKRIGIAAIYKSSEILMSHLGNISHLNKKGAIDLVTEADMMSEKIIIKTILSNFPDHSILAEESGLTQQSSKFQWIIDPLDGTTNFAHQLNIFSTSIAFAIDGDIKLGLVMNPVTGELFSAVKGEGASLNNVPIHVSKTSAVSESLLVTGFPYNFKYIFQPLIKRFCNCLYASQGVRRLGSAALDLCFVACGRFEGFWEQNLKPWDTAAGVLIAKEAGAVITDFSNNNFTIDKKEIIATNGKIHKEMLSLMEVQEREYDERNR